MELLQLTYFCEAARCENFTKTAKKFSVPASDISQTISRLEKELGKKLFDRRANSVTLNENGRLFLEYVKPALGSIEEAVKRLGDSSSEFRCELKIQICICRSIVTKAIEKFKEMYPEVSFYISHSTESDEEFDITVADENYSSGKKVKHLLMDENILLAMPCANPLAKKKHITADDLKSERFVTMRAGSSLFNATVRLCSQLGFEPGIAIQSDDPFYIRQYIEMGLGIAFFPEMSWRGQFSENIVLKNVGDFKRKTYAYCDGEKYMNKAAIAFLNMLIDVFEKINR